MFEFDFEDETYTMKQELMNVVYAIIWMAIQIVPALLFVWILK